MLIGTALVNDEGVLGAIGMVVVGFVRPAVHLELVHRVHHLAAAHAPAGAVVLGVGQADAHYFQSQLRATPHLHFPRPYRFVLRNVMNTPPTTPTPGCRSTTSRTPSKRSTGRIAGRSSAYSGPRQFLRMLRTCRLYDYGTHRWFDYDGTPTTPGSSKTPEVVGEPG